MNPSDHSLHRVFVYGTLRPGGSNHFRMAGGRFLGRGWVRGRLYRIDWYPGLMLDPQAGRVVGELFEVNQEQLLALDVFEGVSAGEVEGSEYRRVLTEVTDGEKTIQAWVWEWVGAVDDEKKLIHSGDWLESASHF